jgi:hypothetical protein
MLSRDGYGPGDAHRIRVGADTYALGLGALGHTFEDCRAIFGEFVAAAGSAAFMPTGGASTPDYMMSEGEFVPDVQALYAIVFRGSPALLLRFEAAGEGSVVALSEVVRVCAETAGVAEFGVIIAAEVAGLVCAVLRRSPAAPDGVRFDFPAVRNWMSFTPEHEHARSSALVAGVVSTSPDETLRPFLRPVKNEACGHFHAAVTAFRPLPRGELKIGEVLAQAFQPRSVVSVAHLLRDSRAIEGAGESEFVRGACWVFPLAGREGVAR